jgi:hypothetical protein
MPAVSSVPLDISRQQIWPEKPGAIPNNKGISGMFAPAADVVDDVCSNSFDYSAFGPREHITNLHPKNGRGGFRHGVISFAQRVRDREKPWKEWVVPAGSSAVIEAERLLQQDNRADIYVSQAAFARWRSISQITAVGACYSDLDYHTRARWKGKKPHDVANAVMPSG